MKVKKDEVAGLLRARGEHDKAALVQCALPQHVDTEADAGLLHQFDVNVSEVTEVAAEGGTDEPLSGAGSA